MIFRSEASDAWSHHALRHSVVLRMAGTKITRAPADWLLRLAREAGVAAVFGSPPLDTPEARLAIFRSHHAAARAASPLALDLLAHQGWDADEAVWRLRPDGRWASWLSGPRPLQVRRLAHRWGRGTVPVPAESHYRNAFLHAGLRLDDLSGGTGCVRVRLSRTGLEIAARLGHVKLRTMEGVALLTTSAMVPETVKLACIGRDVDAIFGHPCLSGRGYVILAQADLPPRWPGRPSRWAVLVSTGTVAWRVPWARNLACAATQA